MLVGGLAQQLSPVAVSATRRTAVGRVHSINERFLLKITSIKGNAIYAQGRITGTVAGSGWLNLILRNGSRLTAGFRGKNSKGDIVGTGAGRYYVSGTKCYFKGSVSTLGGSDSYAHAKSLGISVSGVVDRRAFTVDVTMHGKWAS
jgi:hypothetical protein